MKARNTVQDRDNIRGTHGFNRVKVISRYLGDRMMNIVFVYPTDQWEFAGLLFSLGWGLTTVQRGDQIGIDRVSDLMTNFVPEIVWGIWAIVLAAHTFVSLFFDKFQAVRLVSATLQSLFWVTLAYAYSPAVSGFLSTAFPMYGGCAALWVLTTVRLYLLRVQFGDEWSDVKAVFPPKHK